MVRLQALHLPSLQLITSMGSNMRRLLLALAFGLLSSATLANVTTVTITNGVPTAGSGTVSTLDNLLGTAGSPSAQVLSIQGVVGGTAVPISAASLPLPTGASTSANQSTMITSLGTIATNSGSPIPDCGATPCTNKIGTVYPQSQYPAGAVPITISTTGTVSATSVTLASATSVTTYLCGFSIRANATAAATGNATVTGTKTGTLNFTQWTAPLASGLGVVEPNLGSQCIPASAAATAIVINSAAPGTGGVVSVSAWGYQL